MNTQQIMKSMARWTPIASKQLLGRTIVKVRYLGINDLKNLGWTDSTVAFQLDDGNWIFASRDDEGNDCGALFTSDEKVSCLPVLGSWS